MCLLRDIPGSHSADLDDVGVDTSVITPLRPEPALVESARQLGLRSAPLEADGLAEDMPDRRAAGVFAVRRLADKNVESQSCFSMSIRALSSRR
jgi:hypothetical protein